MHADLDVRFQRALYVRKPDWRKWEFDPAEDPLLGQIQDGQGELLLCRSFMGETRFLVDYIDRETLEACTFSDPDDAIVFIGLTRRLVEELDSLTATLAASADVQTLVGIRESSLAEGVADAFFFLALEFVIAHEVGHYVLGHIVDRALHLEYAEPTQYQTVDLRGHADELDADEYAIRELCRNADDGLYGRVVALVAFDLLKEFGLAELHARIATTLHDQRHPGLHREHQQQQPHDRKPGLRTAPALICQVKMAID